MKARKDLAARYWPKVDKRGPDECWPWLAANGGASRRGLFMLRGVWRSATWAALELDGRPKPDDKEEACHSCDNPECVNPAHLWWGTRVENMQDKVAKGRHHGSRKTSCPHGHPYSGYNLLIDRVGHRICRECSRKNRRDWRARKRMAAHAEA